LPAARRPPPSFVCPPRVLRPVPSPCADGWTYGRRPDVAGSSISAGARDPIATSSSSPRRLAAPGFSSTGVPATGACVRPDADRVESVVFVVFSGAGSAVMSRSGACATGCSPFRRPGARRTSVTAVARGCGFCVKRAGACVTGTTRGSPGERSRTACASHTAVFCFGSASTAGRSDRGERSHARPPGRQGPPSAWEEAPPRDRA
jgi:hypothetical protein